MEKNKKKESVVFKESVVIKPSVSAKTPVATLKKPAVEGKRVTSEVDKFAEPVSKKKDVNPSVRDDTRDFKVPEQGVVFKPSVSAKTTASTSPDVAQPAKPEVPKASVLVNKNKDTSSPKQNDMQAFKVPEGTGKEKQRNWEWVKNKTQIKIKLINGDTYQGYLRWYDRYAVKLITVTEEIIILKHNILCFFDEPKSRREVEKPEI